MVDLPSDSTSKFLTFLGVGIVATCLVEQHLLLQRVDGTLLTFHATAAEELMLRKQQFAAFEKSNKVMVEANGLLLIRPLPT
jgi:hypothetical protein